MQCWVLRLLVVHQLAPAGVAIGQMTGNIFLVYGMRRGHFTIGNKFPASNFFDPSWCIG